MVALAEAHTVVIVVGVLTFLGVCVTAIGTVMAAAVGRATNREITQRNGGGADGTLAERLDARFDALERRLVRIEQSQASDE